MHEHSRGIEDMVIREGYGSTDSTPHALYCLHEQECRQPDLNKAASRTEQRDGHWISKSLPFSFTAVKGHS